MKKKITIITIIVVIALVFLGISFFENKEFAGGTGTKEDPYLVSTAKHLNNVRNYMDKNFKQINDIDLSDYENWEPIGRYNIDIMLGNGFMGTYDGDGYTIKNLKIDKPEKESLGLFGYIGSSKQKNQIGEIQNLKIENAEINGKGFIGIVTGVTPGKIENVHVSGKLEGYEVIGGIAGGAKIINKNYLGIVNSSANITIKGNIYLGGIVGTGNPGISNTKAKVNLVGKRRIGGILGTNVGLVQNSYSEGYIDGNDLVGGIVGENREEGVIKKSYSNSEVYGNKNTGGIVGENKGINESNFFNKEKLIKKFSEENSKTTKEMKEKKTYSDWDFENIWGIEDGKTYPYLKWEKN
jgi:hypothetical protein